MKFELVFIPFLGTGHLRSTVEMAKLLVERETRLSISLIILPGGEVNALSALPNDRLRYEVITNEDQPNIDATNPEFHVEYNVPKVRGVVAKLVNDYSTKPDSPRIAGVVVDMFCTSMVDVANEFGLPSYLFYTSNAGVLALKFHIQMLYDDNKYDITESDFEESEAVLDVPSLTRPFPVKCLPHAYASKQWLPTFVNQARKFREMKGILVNSVAQLEPYALKFLSSGCDTPPPYPVGPLLQLENGVGVGDPVDEKQSEILGWLDKQPNRSVVFLCFGSMGGFREEQARETAIALERSGHRFLWSLRRASPNIFKEPPREFTDLEEVLPEGFFDRTKERGKVIGWAPQVAVLANPAVGGFVTHGGWNSILESLWFGVPTAPWPLYAEQKFNAFEMVDELGLAVEIRKYWLGDLIVGSEKNTVLVTAEEIERGIMCLMEQDSEVRKRVKEMSESLSRSFNGSWIVSNCVADVYTRRYEKYVRNMIIAREMAHVALLNDRHVFYVCDGSFEWS